MSWGAGAGCLPCGGRCGSAVPGKPRGTVPVTPGAGGDGLGPPRLRTSSTNLLRFLLPRSSTQLCGMLRPGSVPAALSGDVAFGPGDSPAAVPRGRNGEGQLEPPAEPFAPLGGSRQHPPVPSTAHGGPAGLGGSGGAGGQWLCPVPGQQRLSRGHLGAGGRWSPLSACWGHLDGARAGRRRDRW